MANLWPGSGSWSRSSSEKINKNRLESTMTCMNSYIKVKDDSSWFVSLNKMCQI